MRCVRPVVWRPASERASTHDASPCSIQQNVLDAERARGCCRVGTRPGEQRLPSGPRRPEKWLRPRVTGALSTVIENRNQRGPNLSTQSSTRVHDAEIYSATLIARSSETCGWRDGHGRMPPSRGDLRVRRRARAERARAFQSVSLFGLGPHMLVFIMPHGNTTRGLWWARRPRCPRWMRPTSSVMDSDGGGH